MKNSIFRSYSKKILKSEAFVSLIIVFVLAIGIIGTSYALYMDVDSDTDYQLVNVGDLAVGFDNGDNTISMENMTPMEDDIATSLSTNIFSFYIYNTGTYTADYDIKLESIEGNEVSSEFINYQICKDNANICEDIKTLSEAKDGIIYKDILSPKKENDLTNPSVYYFLRVWINNKYKETESKVIKLKVVIDVKNANSVFDNKNTLSGAILNNNNIVINNDIPDLTKVETEEKGLFKTKDNYGYSYYFRGNSNYNYVKFNNMCFRAFRIEGDGATKLILSNINGDCKIDDWNIGTTTYFDENIYKNFESKLELGKLKKSSYCVKNNDSATLLCDNENITNKYVSTISKDELIFAGLGYEISNTNTFLNGNYWLSTKSNESNYCIKDGVIKVVDNIELSNRPVITLKSETLISNGIGTIADPYIVK